MQLNWMRLLSAAQLVIVALAPNCERHTGPPRASVLSGGAIRLAGKVRPPGLGRPALCHFPVGALYCPSERYKEFPSMGESVHLLRQPSEAPNNKIFSGVPFWVLSVVNEQLPYQM
jgi:hypothetical protein